MESTVPILKLKRLSIFAYIPIRATENSAGYDLFSAYDMVIPARGKGLVKTDIAIQVPDKHYGRIAPRSSLAIKNYIDVGAGVIDQDYRGNVGVVLFNLGDDDFVINKGDRIAQLIIEAITHPTIVEVDELDNTARSYGGFGSTGV